MSLTDAHPNAEVPQCAAADEPAVRMPVFAEVDGVRVHVGWIEVPLQVRNDPGRPSEVLLSPAPAVREKIAPGAAGQVVSRKVYEDVAAQLDDIRALASGEGGTRTIPPTGVVRQVFDLRRRLHDAEARLVRKPLDAPGCVARAAAALELAEKVGADLAAGDMYTRIADRWTQLAGVLSVLPASSG